MRHLSSFFILFILVGTSWIAIGQSYNSDTDQLLSGLQENYGQDDNYTIEFVMTIRYPEQTPIEQKGNYFSFGDKYRINMPDQKIICNGEKQWVWDIENNYVQIYSASQDAVFSPRGVFDLLHSDQYSYALTYEGIRAGKEVKEIEFKPNDSFSDLGKARLTLDGSKNSIEKLELFYKDATRIELDLVNVSNKVLKEEAFFSFEKERHPGVTVDDLRLE